MSVVNINSFIGLNLSDVSFFLSPPPQVRDVNFQYSPSLPWLFKGLNFGLDMQSRVCIVGPNGSGKSTVIKLITEELKPPEGEGEWRRCCLYLGFWMA